MSKNANLSIGQKLKNLDDSIEWFYGDDFDLDEALKRYEEAVKLSTEIEKDLNELKNKVEVIADLTK